MYSPYARANANDTSAGPHPLSRRSTEPGRLTLLRPPLRGWLTVVTDPLQELQGDDPLAIPASSCHGAAEKPETELCCANGAGGAVLIVAALPRPEPDDGGQPEGTRKGGTVVLGTVTGPPPPTGFADPEDVETGFPGPCVRWSRTSSVPVFAVVTKPPMLGLAIFHSENVIGISANTSIADPMRSAVTGKLTDSVTPCMRRFPAQLW